MSDRALVLGGGGSAGNAWLIGMIAGLFDAGLDVTKADLIIGTSAGSTAAAQVTGMEPSQLFTNIISYVREQRATPVRAVNGGGQKTTAVDHMEITNSIIAAAKDAADMRVRMGAWALGKDASSDISAQEKWRAIVAARLPGDLWPQQHLLIPAVDANTGIPVVFDRDSGVDLVDAVAASCAGGFAYMIGNNQYFDGGYRADVNADLAGRYGRVLVIAPLGSKTRKPLHWGLHLEAQVDVLRQRGIWVETILPDFNSQNALGVGMNLMDLSTRRHSAQAGYNQATALVGQLSEFWQ